MNTRTKTWRDRILRTLAAAAILLPCMYGFVGKFIELVAYSRTDAESAFAVAPVINYLLASAGFLCMFGWAWCNGMFGNIEQPKRTMLETEFQLDRAERLQQHIPLDMPGYIDT